MTFAPNDPRINREGRPRNKESSLVNLRNKVQESITYEEVLSVKEAILSKAKKGDLQACKLFMEYSVGRPLNVNIDHIYTYDKTTPEPIVFNDIIRALRSNSSEE